MSPSLEEHKGFLPRLTIPWIGVSGAYSVVLSMPVLNSSIGFLYLLALISSEPVAIGGPPATCRQPPATAGKGFPGYFFWSKMGPFFYPFFDEFSAPKWAPKWSQNWSKSCQVWDPFMDSFFMMFWSSFCGSWELSWGS